MSISEKIDIRSKSAAVTAATSVSMALLRLQNVHAQDCDVDGGIAGGAGCAAAEGSETELFSDDGVFRRITSVLLFLVGAISVIMLIIGGIRYVISAGDQNQVTAAKNTILYAIIGIVVAFLAFAAVNFVIGQLEA